jgi:GTP cyclohydrolase I
MSNLTSTTEECDLPDHASEHDHRALAIDKVGIKGLSYPIQVLDRAQQIQHTIANVALYVGLPHQFKGTHMSRFVEILNARRGLITIRNLPDILSEVQRKLGADEAHIELTFPYFISKHAPKSGVESLMEYICTLKASKRGAVLDHILGVKVPVKSLCPCSKAVSRYGAHNQRSIVEVQIRPDQFVWIEDIVTAVEGCASAPLFALLKREDEKYITEHAYENPKFVEDLVRDVVLAVQALGGVRWMHVSAENFESIHNHSAYAEIEWSADDPVAQEASALRPDHPGEPDTFGAFVRRQRLSRQFSQQELAEHLGVSAAHLSRVESGEKGLSEDAIDRLAALLGQDAVGIRLRAGILPAELAARVSADPEGFLAWARGAL